MIATIEFPFHMYVFCKVNTTEKTISTVLKASAAYNLL